MLKLPKRPFKVIVRLWRMVDCRKNCGSGPDSLHTHLNELMVIQVGKVSEENVVEMSRRGVD